MSNLQDPHPSRWTLARLETMEPRQLIELARQAARTLGVHRLLLGRCLLAVDRADIAHVVGCSGGVHIAMLQGVDRREALEARRVADRLESLPLLRAAAEEGTVPWASLREIVRKATNETEARWLELARRICYRRIERMVRYTRTGEMPDEDGAVGPDPDEVILQFRVEPEVAEMFQTVMRELSERSRSALPLGEVLSTS